jgi:hypothetical protein
MSVLTIVDVTGTQKYIFGTNKLRENIGASEIVAQATDAWVRDLAGDKVIYCGGGNALLLFDNPTEAKEFARSYTKKLLQDVPNLDVVLAHSKPFDVNSPVEEKEIPTDEMDEFNQPITRKETCPNVLRIVDETFQRLNEKKANRLLSVPLVGLAVSAQCVSTGGVASFDPLVLAKREDGSIREDFDNALRDKYQEKHVSAESFSKIAIADKATQRLKDTIFKGIELGNLEIPRELDHLGRTEGEASFIAVVHTDGNGMGDRIKKHGASAKDNGEWITKMRELSESIHETNLKALKATLKVIRNHIKKNDQGAWVFEGGNGENFGLSFNKKKTKQYFPFRPLIFGGDDLTFVCDARIALDLTAFYLRELEKHNLTDGRPLYARAGIAIVKSHYPFARAYELAEDLAKSAKDRIAELDKNKPDEEKKKVYAVDWHVAMSGLFGSVKEIRDREYTTPWGGKLNMRPLSLQRNDNDDEWRTWEVFESFVKAFQGHDKNRTKEENEKFSWREKRNKVKAFRDALRGGSEKVKEYLRLYKLIEKKLDEAGKPDGTFTSKMPKAPIKVQIIETTGWHGKTCGYFDAIEMIDLYFPLKEKEG